MRASEIEHESNTRSGPWWGWSDVKRGLETLFRWGDVVSAGRTRFERVYALPEQVLPASVRSSCRFRATRPCAGSIAISARAHGVGTADDFADYFRLKAVDAVPAIRELEESGELLPVTVDGWGKPAWLHRDARLPRRMEATALLSPFDPVVWARARALRLFDFHYRIEIYTPANPSACSATTCCPCSSTTASSAGSTSRTTGRRVCCGCRRHGPSRVRPTRRRPGSHRCCARPCSGRG